VSYRSWPMFDIRLTTPDLELRHLTEAFLGSLAAIFPEDVELDPSSMTYDLRWARPDRKPQGGAHQTFWRGRADWRPESWALSFGVFRDGELVGYQGLEGDDFPTLRTVDSSSFSLARSGSGAWASRCGPRH
jgi:hypothetical protein